MMSFSLFLEIFEQNSSLRYTDGVRQHCLIIDWVSYNWCFDIFPTSSRSTPLLHEKKQPRSVPPNHTVYIPLPITLHVSELGNQTGSQQTAILLPPRRCDHIQGAIPQLHQQRPCPQRPGEGRVRRAWVSAKIIVHICLSLFWPSAIQGSICQREALSRGEMLKRGKKGEPEEGLRKNYRGKYGGREISWAAGGVKYQ